jgi:predicted ribosome quality control (RQC) complex YloA/Tae2 family protein
MTDLRRFITSSGKKVTVGKNAKSNNYLTFKLSGEDDLFLHTKDFSGSHVILYLEEEAPQKQDIYEAAVLAAFYSKGKTKPVVKVDYTFQKNVSRHRKDPPGLVEIKDFKTVKVRNAQTEFLKLKRL